MKTQWDKTTGDRHDYAFINEKDVVLGYDYGKEQSDDAGGVSHKEFLEGLLHDRILKRFGKEVLNEIIETVSKMVQKLK